MTDIKKTFEIADDMEDFAAYLEQIADDPKIGVDHEEVEKLANKARATIIDLVSSLVY